MAHGWGRIIELDEGMRIIDEAIAKAKKILLGIPPNSLFTSEGHMKYYTCVYNMCIQKEPYNYTRQLRKRLKDALIDGINSVVLPSLANKTDAPLLMQLLQSWKNYDLMVRRLSGIFLSLEKKKRDETTPSLKVLSDDCFHELVGCNLFDRFRHAVIFLINQERNGDQIDRDLLKNAMAFFEEKGNGNTNLYGMLQGGIINDASNYYTRLASQLLPCSSYMDYIQKATRSLIHEKERVGQYLAQDYLDMLLEKVSWKLLGEPVRILKEKQKAENHETEEHQGLFYIYNGTHIQEDISGSLSP